MERIRRKAVNKKIARTTHTDEQEQASGGQTTRESQVAQTLQLQRTIGNQATQRLIAQQTGGPTLQRSIFSAKSSLRKAFGTSPVHTSLFDASDELGSVMLNGKGYSLLREAAVKEFSTENFDCLEAISDYIRSPGPRRASAVYDVFVARGAPREANFGNAIAGPIQTAIAAKQFSPDLFAAAVKDLTTNISDTFYRAMNAEDTPFYNWYKPRKEAADATKEKKKAKDAEDKRVLDYSDLKIGQRSIIGANLLPKLHGILRLMLSSAEGYRLFSAYAKAELSEENLMLLEVVSNYLDAPSRAGAESIANVFVRVGSTYEVNLPNKARQQMLDVIDSPYTGAEGSEGPGIDAGLFDKIIDATVANVFDTYSRIVGSQLDEAEPLREWIAKQDKAVKTANDKKFNGWGARLKKRFGR